MKRTAVKLFARLLLTLPTLVAQPFGSSDESTFHILKCFTPCASGYTGNEVIPGTGCVYYHECWKGDPGSRKGCGPPLVFNVERDYCDFPSNVDCVSGLFECPDSYSPTTTKQQTPRPSQRPTTLPTVKPVAPEEIITSAPSAPEEIITSAPSAPEEIITSAPSTNPNTPQRPTPLPSQLSTWATVKPVAPEETTIPNTISPYENPNTEPPTMTISTAPPVGGGGNSISHVESKRNLIEQYILISYNNAGVAYPSKSYTYDRFMQSLQVMGVDGFGADFKFNVEGNGDKYQYGLVNLAAFLANCMVESIETDSCDELNWQQMSGRFAISNSCGQGNRSYQDETCDTDNDIFSCDVDPSMDITADSASSQPRAPPPLECKPKGDQGFHSGYWDASSGTLVANTPYSNDAGRADTEGCCWWGRGALLTRGVCNIGKLDYYLGKRGADLGRSTLYPTTDFCQYPQATCASGKEFDLRWIVAFFEWSERIQRYEKNGWVYEDMLKEFVDSGMSDDSFIDSVSRILARGCHPPECSDLEDRMLLLDLRRSNFYMIMNDIFDVKTLLKPPDITRQPQPTPASNSPKQRPTLWPTTDSSMAMPTVKQTTPRPSEQPTRTTAEVITTTPPAGPPPQQSPNLAEIHDKNSNPLAPSPSSNDEYSNSPQDNELMGLPGNGAVGAIYPANHQLIPLTVTSAVFCLLIVM
ncbi:hypothetical protein ACHAXR_009152 [Thalassiosira sp. AJA248-18]